MSAPGAEAPNQAEAPGHAEAPYEAEAPDGVSTAGPEHANAHHDASVPQGSDAAGPPDDDALALAMAAQGFLASRWLGALLMVYSFTHLYVFGLRPGASVPMALVVAAVFLLAGSAVWWRSRVYAERLEVPWAPRWAGAADLFAYTAIVFWILFLLALWLLSRGVAPF